MKELPNFEGAAASCNKFNAPEQIKRPESDARGTALIANPTSRKVPSVRGCGGVEARVRAPTFPDVKVTARTVVISPRVDPPQRRFQ